MSNDTIAPGLSEQNQQIRQVGRPEYKPTAAERELVRTMKAARKTNATIAAELKLSRNTLRKHFAQELAGEPVQATADPQLDFGGAAHNPALEAAPIGRPEYEPSQRARDDVRLWAADDWTEDRMARQLGISRNTLRKHFAEELEHGADKVRAMVLRDLMRSSAQGKVGASNKLLEITGLVPPPAAPRAPEAAQQDEPEELGKKERARIDARTADAGTEWADLVH